MDSNPKRPDGGYGWVMVGCSFVLHMLNIGFMFSLSFLYVSWLDEFDESKGLTSWIISLGAAAMFMLGPIPARLVELFSYGTVTVIGGLLTCIGCSLAFFATSVPFLIGCIGICAGIGCSLTYLPGVAIIGVYFDRRRSLAMGIATCGVGVGTMTASPLLNALENEYGWRGSMLIMGALSLHKCVAGMLMRNPTVDDHPIVIQVENVDATLLDDTYDIKKGNDSENCRSSLDVDDSAAEGRQECLNGKPLHWGSTSANVLSLPPKTRETLKCGGSVQHLSAPSLTRTNGQLRPFISLEGLDPRKATDILMTPCQERYQNNTSLRDVISRSLINFDMIYLGSMHSIHLVDCKNNGDGDTNVSLALELSDGKGHIPPHGNKFRKPALDKSKEMCYRCVDSASMRANIDLLRSKTFCILAVSSFLTNLSYLTPLIYLVDRAVHNGIDKSVGALLITVNGGGNLLGRFLAGFICNRLHLNCLTSYIFVLCSCGIVTMVSPICGGESILHGIYAGAFGLLIGAHVTLIPVVVMDLVGISRLATAYGLLLVFCGTGCIVGPPLAGWMFDWTQSYTLSYVINGLFLVLSGVLLLPILLTRTCGCLPSTSSQ